MFFLWEIPREAPGVEAEASNRTSERKHCIFSKGLGGVRGEWCPAREASERAYFPRDPLPTAPELSIEVTEIRKCYQCGSSCENWIQRRLCVVARLGHVRQMTCTDPGAPRPRVPWGRKPRALWPSHKGLCGVTCWETGQARAKQLFTEWETLLTSVLQEVKPLDWPVTSDNQVKECILIFFSSRETCRTSLASSGERLHTSNAGGVGSIPGQGTKIPHAM